VDAVSAELAVEGALVHQVIEMSERLTEGKAHLVPVEVAAEENLNHVEGSIRNAASGDHLAASRPVMCGKAIDPSVQPEEWEVVRRQGESLGRYRVAHLAKDAR
jgi:hypothetical protein